MSFFLRQQNVRRSARRLKCEVTDLRRCDCEPHRALADLAYRLARIELSWTPTTSQSFLADRAAKPIQPPELPAS
jgi:hypothetical protein